MIDGRKLREQREIAAAATRMRWEVKGLCVTCGGALELIFGINDSHESAFCQGFWHRCFDCRYMVRP